MEYVEGRNLSALVRRCGRLPVADACEIARQAALGLDHSHRQELVHRDIQPSNVMLANDGTVKVLDMGLARLQDSLPPRAGLTASGQLLGNPDYVSPEQACGEGQIDIRSDIYGLGCTLYYLLAGAPPFTRRIRPVSPPRLLPTCTRRFRRSRRCAMTCRGRCRLHWSEWWPRTGNSGLTIRRRWPPP